MKEYWYCIIGPVERDLIPDGGDLPMRNAVRTALNTMAPTAEWKTLSSGWGITDAQAKRMTIALHSDFPIEEQNKLLRAAAETLVKYADAPASGVIDHWAILESAIQQARRALEAK